MLILKLHPVRSLAWLLLVLLVAACATQPLENNPLDDLRNPEALRQEALALVNAARRDSGLPPLRFNSALNAAAQAHAEDMARRGFYNHRSPERRDVLDRFRAHGGTGWAAVGENIVTCHDCRADLAQVRTFQGRWMQSPGHRRNILTERFDGFGFGIASSGGKVYAVQTFVRERY